MPCAESAINTFGTNAGTFPASYVPSVRLKQGEQSTPTKWHDIGIQVRSNTKLIVPVEDFIWLELSIVPEVERVFVDRRGNFFNVMTVVNPRDVELRKRIFMREQAIIDALPAYEFDFGIITRMDFPLEQIVTDAQRPAYARR